MDINKCSWDLIRTCGGKKYRIWQNINDCTHVPADYAVDFFPVLNLDTLISCQLREEHFLETVSYLSSWCARYNLVLSKFTV